MTVDMLAAHFFDDRWEQDRIKHFYFLDTPAYGKLSGLAKHVVLKGHRGTGKTTLLRAMDWRERLTNEHLRNALGMRPFSDRVVGCFLQIKLLPVDMLDIWLGQSKAHVRFAVIATYLRATWLIEACDALAGLNKAYAFASYGDQLADFADVARTLWDWVPPELELSAPGGRDLISLDSVRDIATAVAKYLRSAAAIEFPSPEATVSRLDLTEFGRIVALTFRALAKHVGRLDASGPWLFRVCMDEGEFLSEDWAISVRSLIRETDAPVYLAVSVLHSLGTDTRASGADLSIDDRELVDLDDRPPEQMARLLNGIVLARLEMCGVKARNFDVQSFLGNPDVEELFALAIASSEGRAAERYRFEAKLGGGRGAVRQHLESIGAIRKSPVAAARRDESAGYRKKKTAGYLHLLGSIGIDRPVYAGWRIAIAMADNSVRDFIRFLRYGMEISSNRDRAAASIADISRFLGLGRLGYTIQDSALDRLGRRKLESVSRNLADPAEATVLIRLFGEISHRVDFYGDSKLSSPNATRLTLRRVSTGTLVGVSYDSIIGILRRCASYGYLADLTETQPNEVSFRVNRSLARHLGFSYWKPQYSTAVHMDQIEYALNNRAIAPQKWVDRRRDARSAPRPLQTPLPGLSFEKGDLGVD